MALPNSSIKAHIDAPQAVEIQPGAKTVEITVRSELRNETKDSRVLHAPSEDAAVFWHVLNESSREVQAADRKRAAKPKGDSEADVTQLVPAGHSVHRTKTLTLDASKLKAGATYTVRAEIWGQAAETRFVVVEVPKLAKLVPAKGNAPAKKKAQKAVKKATKAVKKAAAKVKSATAGAMPGVDAGKKAAPKKKTGAKKAGAKKPAARKAAGAKKAAGGKQATTKKAAGKAKKKS